MNKIQSTCIAASLAGLALLGMTGAASAATSPANKGTAPTVVHNGSIKLGFTAATAPSRKSVIFNGRVINVPAGVKWNHTGTTTWGLTNPDGTLFADVALKAGRYVVTKPGGGSTWAALQG